MENNTTKTTKAVKPNIYARMLSVAYDVKNVEKNISVNVGGKNNGYKAVADYDVVIAVKKAEKEHGVISIPVAQELVDTQIVTARDSYGNERSTFIDIVKMRVRFVNVDDPTDYVEVESFGRGIDAGDKGFGKASTYARKYALLNAYKIATGEDPDKDASVETTYIQHPTNNRVRISEKKFADMVAAHAMGKKTADGVDARSYYLAHVADADADKFDKAVLSYKINNDIP